MGARDTPALVRSALLALLLLAVGLTGAELLLLGHTETIWQAAPLVLMAIVPVAVAAWLYAPGIVTLRLFQGLMVTHIACGAVGLYLHYSGNAEFEMEMYPSLSGLDLFWEAMAGATPALAPAMMGHIGLLGLLYVYRHPKGSGRRAGDPANHERQKE